MKIKDNHTKITNTSNVFPGRTINDKGSITASSSLTRKKKEKAEKGHTRAKRHKHSTNHPNIIIIVRIFHII
jgi:hypothetical protein